jgi:hypothetical protein
MTTMLGVEAAGANDESRLAGRMQMMIFFNAQSSLKLFLITISPTITWFVTGRIVRETLI